MWVEGRGEALQLEGLVKKEFFKLGVQEGAKALPKAQLKKEIKAIFQYQQLAWFTKPEVLAWRLEALEELLVA